MSYESQKLADSRYPWITNLRIIKSWFYKLSLRSEKSVFVFASLPVYVCVQACRPTSLQHVWLPLCQPMPIYAYECWCTSGCLPLSACLVSCVLVIKVSFLSVALSILLNVAWCDFHPFMASEHGLTLSHIRNHWQRENLCTEIAIFYKSFYSSF